MPIFLYQARDAKGEQVKGRVEANNEREAASLVKQRSLYLTTISQVRENSSLLSLKKFNRVKFKDIVNITRQLATMVTAGLQIPEALNLLRNQSTNSGLTEVLTGIYRDIEAGGTLASALIKYPKYFPNSYIALIKAGESSGTLDKVLTRLAENLEKDLEFQGRVKGALVYPIIIIVAMIVVAGILMVVVVPQLTQMYADFGADLPLATRILQGASSFSVKFWWLIIIAGFFGWRFFNSWKKTTVGQHAWDGFILKLPLFGPLTKQIVLVEFTRTLSLLVGSGVHIIDSLEILQDSMTNVHFKEALKDITLRVEKGLALGNLFSENPLFPPILAQMVKIGEETGKMDETLLKLSTYFESEADGTVKALTTAIEPLIMIVLGLGVGFIVFAVITPLYNLTSQFS